MTPNQDKFDGDIFDDPAMIQAREKVILGLEQGPQILTRTLAARLNGMRQCGEFPVCILIQNGRVIGVLRNQCRGRGCPVCDTLKAAATRRDLDLLVSERVDAGARFSLITLTMPHARNDLLQKLLAFLFAGVGRFQRSAGFKHHVSGYARGIEIPWSPENGFHPHVHYIAEAKLWPKEEIKELWTRSMLAVGGPFVPPNGAHVKGLKDAGSGLLEAVGYPFKVHDLATMPMLALCQLLYVTKHRHLTQLCKPWRKRIEFLVAQRDAATQGMADADGSSCVPFLELYRRIRSGDREAFDLAVEAAQFLVRGGSKKAASTLLSFLRIEAALHRWPLPDDSDEGAGAAVPV